MGSTRAEGRAAGGELRLGADLVAAAAALRWARPDLTAALADHVLEESSVAGEQDCWLAAAGWAVHARATTGDGRQIACEVLTGLQQWGSSALTTPAAHRLRVELAMVAAAAGEVELARDLVAPVTAERSDPELRADLLCVRARCAVEDGSDDVADALDAAAAAWADAGGDAGEIGGASVDLIRAVVERRAGRPVAAVDRAADGLARLERGRGRSGRPSVHLAAALAAEWISALLDAGRSAEAMQGCRALLPRLSEQARPCRQLALLRLSVARAVAAEDSAADSAQLLDQAAEDASSSDAPDLESVCRTALGALHEQASRLETALETLQLAVAAERRDRDRSRRFQAALAELPREVVRPAPSQAPSQATSPTTGQDTSRAASRPTTQAPEAAPDLAGAASASDSETTMLLPLITRGDRKLVSSRRREESQRNGESAADSPADAPSDDARDARRRRAGSANRGRSRVERPFAEPRGGAKDAGPGQDEAPAGWAQSPIGDLLIHSRRGEADVSGHDGGPAPHRNGTPDGEGAERADRADDTRSLPANGSATGSTSAERATGSGADNDARRRSAAERSDPPATAGWLPTLDSRQDERPARRRGTRRSRSGDVDRAREPGPSADTAAALRDELGNRPASSGPGARHRNPGTTDLPAAQSRDEEPRPGAGDRGAEGAPGRRRSNERAFPVRGSRGNGRAGAEVTGERAAPWVRDDSPSGDPTAGHAPPGGAEEMSPYGGHRSRGDDPWATGSWSAEAAGSAGAADSATGGPAERSATANGSTGAGDDSDGWLSAALADLDRALSGVGLGRSATSAPTPEPAPEQVAEPPAAPDGCAVVIDIAREGRRFAGRRAATVIRGVSDRLTDRLPPAAGLQFGDSETLEITGPGWTRSDATDWMHRMLPSLLDGFVAEEDLPSAQLRAAVHDADGPVGAQILQNLAGRSARRRESDAGDRPRGAVRDLEAWGDVTDQASEARAREYRAAARSGLPGRSGRVRTVRSRRGGEPEPAERLDHDDAGGWPWSGATGPADQEIPTDDAWPTGSDGDDGSERRSASPVGLVPAGLVTAGWMSGSVNGSADRAGVLDSGSDAESAGRHGSGEPSRARGSEDEARSSRHGAGRRGGQGDDHTPAGSEPSRAERTADDTAGSRGSNGSPNGSSNGSSNGGSHGSAKGGPNGVADTDFRHTGDGYTGDGYTGDGHGADPDRDADRPERAEKAEPTGDLGIADLLAGALAAYRKI